MERPLISVADPLLIGARRVFYLGCLLVPLTAIRVPSGLQFSDVAFLLSGLLTVLSAAQPKIKPSRWLLTASALALCASLALAVTSTTPVTEIAMGGRVIFVWGVWPVLAVAVLRDQHQLSRAAAFFVAGSCLSAFVAIAQVVGIDLRGDFLAAAPDTPGIYTRLIGLNGHPNGQGGTLAIAFTISAAALIYRKRWGMASCALVMTTIGILLSGSISGTIMAILGLLVVVVRGHNNRAVALIVIFAAPAWALTRAFQQAQTGVLTPFQRVSSATGQTGVNTLDLRLQTIDSAWQQIVANPWQGVGLAPTEGGTYNGVTPAHNMEVLAWYQGGPLMLLGVIIATLIGLAFLWRRTGDPLSEMLFAAVVCGLAFAQTGPALFDRYIWMPVVLAFVYRHQRSEGAQDHRKLSEEPPSHLKARSSSQIQLER